MEFVKHVNLDLLLLLIEPRALVAILTIALVAAMELTLVMVARQDSVSTPQEVPAAINVTSKTARTVMLQVNASTVSLDSSCQVAQYVPVVQQSTAQLVHQ